jgi:uncharacterized membrane protein YdfJ with MMPL/SSD domain
MFALAGSSVLSIAQIGVTIGVGLMIDTVVVCTLVLPSLGRCSAAGSGGRTSCDRG